MNILGKFNQPGKLAKGFCFGLVFSLAAQTAVMASVVTPPTAGNTQTQNTQTTTAAIQKPVVQSQGAILYDVTHNQVLFEQNADMRFYPASTTKLMTALLALENLQLTDTVKFSSSAVTNLELGAVTLNVKAGDVISVQDCLFGLMLKSANEIANGLAEKISGSVSNFAALMNQKAASLGCTNTNFVNPNGLNNANHYTTARDMALIAKAAFDNPVLAHIASTPSYDFPATPSVPTVRKLTMGHKMLIPTNAEYYQGAIGGKTGYTSLAGNTLVTCAERDGVRMIAVVLKSKQSHYQDTKAMLDYGFEVQKTMYAGNTGNTGSTGNASGPGGGGAAGPSGNQQTGNNTSGGNSYPGNNSTGNSQNVSGPTGNGSTGGQNAGSGSWAQDATGWRYMKSNGSYAKNETLLINNEYYYFKEDQYMVSNSWHLINGGYYFFRPSGGLASNRWIETNGMWYYVDNTGKLLTNGTTPDGFKVDSNGVWIK